MKRRNYLNNRDLLKEIHKSKNLYSSYIDVEASDYDIIVLNVDELNIRTVAQAKRNHADRLARKAHIEAVKTDQTVKLANFAINWKKITKESLIFRVMTFDHIPLEPGRKKNPKTVADHHTHCNFPPFQHFRFNESSELKCVGKSHWEGGMELSLIHI